MEQNPTPIVPMTPPAGQSPQVVSADPGAIEWRASEYINHEKSPTWYLGLGLSALALFIFAIFVIQQYTFAALIVVMVVTIIVWARRSAPEISYRLDFQGVTIDGKHFSFSHFRAFGIVADRAIFRAVLIPAKRFSPNVQLYFPEDIGEPIVDVLGTMLPMEDIKMDVIEAVTDRLNF